MPGTSCRRPTGVAMPRTRGAGLVWALWVLPLVGLAAAALLVALAALMVEQDLELLNLALAICAAVLPLTTGAAIMRYRCTT